MLSKARRRTRFNPQPNALLLATEGDVAAGGVNTLSVAAVIDILRYEELMGVAYVSHETQRPVKRVARKR